jgi:tRNA(Ile)-lysidine synthase
MESPVLDVLAARLRDAPFALGPSSSCVVAFSGGLDSTLLLHALVHLGYGAGLTAVHVDHGIHPDSAAWSAHCERIAARLGVRYVVRRVEVRPRPGESVESAARHARYAALAAELVPGGWLFTAHHADDQLETLLYRLVRGTGVRGLRGIAEHERFAAGRIGRPLLALKRSEIRQLAQEWQLDWTDDPSNADLRFDRNYLRAAVVPVVLQRWPEAAVAAVRYARAAGDAESILDEVARSDAQAITALDRLPLQVLAGMTAPRRRNLLRHALATLGIASPAARQLASIERLCDPGSDVETVHWPGGEAHRFGGYAYLLPSLPPRPTRAEVRRLTEAEPLQLACGRIAVAPTAGPGLPAAWLRAGLVVRYRHGGERFRPIGAPRDVSLKEWMRSAGIVPWMRGRVPLLVRGEEIVAVADLCLSAAAQTGAEDCARVRIAWDDHPRVH